MQWKELFADITSFYTEISHTWLLQSYEWLRNKACRHKGARSRRLCVNRRGSRGVRYGRSFCKSTHAEISFDMLFDLLVWDATNCTFTWGESVVLLQTWGIAMGTPPAPPNAITCAAYAEWCWLHAITADTHWLSTSGTHLSQRFHTCRYMDDTASVISYCNK
jgi:hypothetical protein